MKCAIRIIKLRINDYIICTCMQPHVKYAARMLSDRDHVEKAS